MATPAQPAPSSRQISIVIDLFSRGVAALAIALYVAGFLTVSLHHYRYGFIETNPFRPRVLAAGTWFFILTGIPIAIVGLLGRRRLPWLRFAQLLYPYYLGCLVLAIPTSFLFNAFAPPDKAAPTWRSLLIGLAIIGVLIFLVVTRKIPTITAIASTLFVIVSIQHTIQELPTTHFGFAFLALWFFAVGVVVQIAVNIYSELTVGNCTVILLTALLLLSLFSRLYYPFIKSSWGGGTPLSVTMYFNKDSPIKPSQGASVQLIDESDAGFYIVRQGERTAIFVPRNSVSLVEFSDESSGSTLLK
jgi:hypothetical protein